jgi:cobalt/nickel transport system permease protein
MHIMEGVLSWQRWLVALPCIIYGIYHLKKILAALPLLGVTGGFIFFLSSLKLPSITGRCSHPTGTGLSTRSFGPVIITVVCAIVLLYQSFFLAIGGLSIHGANIVFRGIVGPLAGNILYQLLRDASTNIFLTVFLVTAFAYMFTYFTTSLEWLLAFPAETGRSFSSFIMYLSVFAVTRIPPAVIGGIVLAPAFKYIIALKPDILIPLKISPEEKIDEARSGI